MRNKPFSPLTGLNVVFDKSAGNFERKLQWPFGVTSGYASSGAASSSSTTAIRYGAGAVRSPLRSVQYEVLATSPGQWR